MGDLIPRNVSVLWGGGRARHQVRPVNQGTDGERLAWGLGVPLEPLGMGEKRQNSLAHLFLSFIF